MKKLMMGLAVMAAIWAVQVQAAQILTEELTLPSLICPIEVKI